ncbi:bacterio-opsin activator domain-containing protein [Haloarculaceae archaeon H-GB11]|nr:bacterio-opsin activator domain-containing protein [Haloarculaceae archaeon H-GB11]
MGNPRRARHRVWGVLRERRQLRPDGRQHPRDGDPTARGRGGTGTAAGTAGGGEQPQRSRSRHHRRGHRTVDANRDRGDRLRATRRHRIVRVRVDRRRRRVLTAGLRSHGGRRRGYLDDKTVSVDPDDSYSAGATGRAFRTGEMQTTQDVRNDSRYDTWENVGEKHGFRSSAAIPVVHDGTTYGVLNVYAERPDAFAGEEGAVISQLGEIVGHAIAAADRKRALMSDEVVELEFAITDVFASLGLDDETDGRIEINNAVPLANDEFLVFGTATADACDHLESLVEALPHWRDLTWTDAENGTFELRFTEPPVLSVLASMGGSIESAVIEDGDYHMTLHLSPTVEVRPLIDAVRESYPDAQLLKRRQISKYDETYDRVQHALTTELTERQRTMLEAAYHAGFFEWPRTTSGESIAESMDVSPPTFHQHLRKAEQKVFESLLA